MPLSARVAPLPGGAAAAARLGPIGEALRLQLAGADPGLADFYRARNYRPMWIEGWRLKPDARGVLQAVTEASADALDPANYDASGLADVLSQAASGAPADLARAEIALSRAAGGYLADLHTPAAGAEMIYADAAVAPPRGDAVAMLQAIARAPAPGEAVAELRRMNPIYERLRAALAERPGDAVRLRANLERARALPAGLGERYLLVDAAAQILWLYDHGRAVDSMPVVVGKPSEPTPAMAGLVRYAVARPYWNVPPDLVAHEIAPQVLRQGPGFLEAKDMEALSDWTADAEVLAPETIDWAAVAAGRQVLRVRQRPGPRNMMGEVKFIFPNSLGVYLHDSPLRQYFTRARRTESAGCVRLSDAPRLARWLLADQAAELAQPGAPETRIDLDRPIPVYIVYFTLAPQDGDRDGVLAERPDIYRRDATLVARLSKASARAGTEAGQRL